MSDNGHEHSWNDVEMFGIRFSNMTFGDLCAAVDARIAAHEPGYIITPNVDHICRYQYDEALRKAYEESFLVVPDGVPVMWASKLIGTPLREKLSGSDLVLMLSEYAADKGYSEYLFGAAEGVAEQAAERLTHHFSKLKIAGTYSPPMGFERDEDGCIEAAHKIRDASPDICFVGLGSPKQEVWLQRYCRETGVPVMLGVGAGLDFAAGNLKRAPLWMQHAGLEWFWRMCLEPRRMPRRYLIDDSYFFVLLWREFRRTHQRHADDT